MKSVNAKNTTFLVRKKCRFDQYLTSVYQVLQINSNKYSIIMMTTLKFSNTICCVCSLPMKIFNDEIIEVVLHMVSDAAMHGCISIFVATSP